MSMMVFVVVGGFVELSTSVLTTHSGVPTLSVPSRMSTPMTIGSRRANVWMIFSRHGQYASPAASFFLASWTSLLYAVNLSNKW